MTTRSRRDVTCLGMPSQAPCGTLGTVDASFLLMRAKKDTDEEVIPGLVVKGGPEALRGFFGKWIAVDPNGEIRAAGTTFDEVAYAVELANVQEPEFVYVPAGSFVG